MSASSHDPDSTSVAEWNGHIKGRPISWVVVVLVCVGFVAAGVGLVASRPWLFYVGVGVVALGAILGAITHAMADVTARVETVARQRDAVEPPSEQPTLGAPAQRSESAQRSEEPAAH
ncbi:MAG TPA: HGxxPAAW family protein [Acidothermaceae bacterium]|jgi:hypothetical protein|nr:HGxxPAAW family protein [Acidothermaceae bacterium]